MSIEDRLATLERLVLGTHGTAARVNALEERAAFHEQQHNALRHQFDTQFEDIEALQRQTGELRAELEELETAVGVVSSRDGTSLAAQLAAVKEKADRVKELATDVAGQQQAIGRIKRYVGIPAAAASPTGAAATAGASLAQRVQTLESRTDLLTGNQLQIREGVMWTAQWKILIEGHSDEIQALYQSKATTAEVVGVGKLASAATDAVAALGARVTELESTVGSRSESPATVG